MTKKKGEEKVKNIAILIESLSQESISRNLAKYFIAVAPKSLSFEIIEIKQLALYNEDLDNMPPKAWTKFREKMKSFSGYLIITPDANHSFSGSQKNAIDIASKLSNKNTYYGKPGAVVSISKKPAVRNNANPHLRQSLMFLNIQTTVEPDGHISDSKELFDKNGNIANKSTLEFIKKFMKSFNKWVSNIS